MSVRLRTSLSLSVLAIATAAAAVSGCAANSNDDDEESSEGEAAISGTSPGDGVLYFHGMSRLGLSRNAMRGEVRGADLLAPSLTDAQLQSAPSANVLAFISQHRTSSIVSGYSLGRIPVFRLMKAEANGMTRVVLIDPTYDSASGIGSGIGGGIARRWLDGSEDRTLLFVYGDVTKELGGDRSYVTELTGHPRAELCYLPGDHARFRKDDMARALTAESCSELKTLLDR